MREKAENYLLFPALVWVSLKGSEKQVRKICCILLDYEFLFFVFLPILTKRRNSVFVMFFGLSWLNGETASL